jgi:hypothetical protein
MVASIGAWKDASCINAHAFIIEFSMLLCPFRIEVLVTLVITINTFIAIKIVVTCLQSLVER